MVDDRQGKFFINTEEFERNPGVVRNIMSKCIITRAEMLYHSNEVEYYATSPCFKPIAGGCALPIYVWEVDAINGDISIEAKEVKNESEARGMKWRRELNQLPIII